MILIFLFFASEGISIFGVEIYQSLVSYPMLISYFFSLIILKPEILKKLNIIRDKKVFFYILLVCTLLSSIFVLSVLSRRITLLICVISLVLLLIKNILNLRNKKYHINTLNFIFYN